MLDRRLRLLVITPFSEREWIWVRPHFDSSEIEWTFRNGALFGLRQHRWLKYALSATEGASQYDAVVTHAPYMTLYVAIAMRMRGRRRLPHFAFSFNHGNKRFFSGALLHVARRALRDVRLFVVYSEAERRLLGQMYRIPSNRIGFQHWAVRPPVGDGRLPEAIAALQPYVCCVGRNNRDFRTFLAAMHGLDIRGVVVCRAGALDGLLVPSNVLVQVDLPEPVCIDVIRGSTANVVPLQDASTGAGHMTLVTAMQLGKAQVVTMVDTVTDYFVDGVHGVGVPHGDVGAMREAIVAVFGNERLRARCGLAAKEFADRWLCEAAAAGYARSVLECFAGGRPLPLEPPGWSRPGAPIVESPLDGPSTL